MRPVSHFEVAGASEIEHKLSVFEHLQSWEEDDVQVAIFDVDVCSVGNLSVFCEHVLTRVCLAASSFGRNLSELRGDEVSVVRFQNVRGFPKDCAGSSISTADWFCLVVN